MKRVLFAIAVVLSVLSGAAWWAFTRAGAPVAHLQRWPVDHRREYQLAWHQRQTSALPTGEGEASGTLELRGQISLTPRVADDGSQVVVLALDALPTFEATALGQALPVEGVVGAEAWVVLDARGAVSSLRFAEREAPTARYLLQGLAAELFAPVPDSAEPLTIDEKLPIGDLAATVGWADATHATLVRQRTRFLTYRLGIAAPANLQLSSRADFHFDPQGGLQAIEANETISGADSHGRPQLSRQATLTLKLTDARATTPLVLSLAQQPTVRRPGPVTSEVDVQAALLESRAAGISAQTLTEIFTTIDDPKAIPNRAAFVWQASGYLTLHPERCRDLVPLFDTAKSDGMRAQLVDLLVSAAHPQAQAALREVMTQHAAGLDPRVFEELYQRLGLVPHPTPETVQLVLDEHAKALHSGDAAARRVRAFTLGSMAKHLATTDAAKASLLGDVLLDDVIRAPSAKDQALALRALGNAADERTTDTVRDLLKAQDPELRAAAAMALRQVTSPQAQAMLAQQLRDERDARAQSAALDALRHRTLDAAALDTLRDLAVEHTLAAGAERALLEVLVEQSTGTKPSPAVIQTLQALITTPSTPASIRYQARMLLQRLAS